MQLSPQAFPVVQTRQQLEPPPVYAPLGDVSQPVRAVGLESPRERRAARERSRRMHGHGPESVRERGGVERASCAGLE